MKRHALIPSTFLGLFIFSWSHASPIVRIKKVAPGSDHTCALDVSGTVYCWGYNLDGTLGVGQTFEDLPLSSIPLEVTLPEVAIDIVGMTGFTCALGVSGSAYCWGANHLHQLGNALSAPNSTAPLKVATSEKFLRLEASDGGVCGWNADGSVYCWGSISRIQQPYPTPTLFPSPDNSPILQVSGGPYCRLILTANGAVHSDFLPDLVTSALNEPVKSISSGEHVCAVTVTGRLFCWGINFYGSLGVNSTDSFIPVPLEVRLPAPVVQVQNTGHYKGETATAGDRFSSTTCVSFEDGTHHCWGQNIWGELGAGLGASDIWGDATGELESTYKLGVLSEFTKVFTGQAHICGVTATGLVKCWGANEYFQLGSGVSGNYGDDQSETVLNQSYVEF